MCTAVPRYGFVPEIIEIIESVNMLLWSNIREYNTVVIISLKITYINVVYLKLPVQELNRVYVIINVQVLHILQTPI